MERLRHSAMQEIEKWDALEEERGLSLEEREARGLSLNNLWELERVAKIS